MKIKEFAYHGFVQVSAETPPLQAGCISANTQHIIEAARAAYTRGSQFAVFPELSLTGYTANDLFKQDLLIRRCQEGLARLIEASMTMPGMVLMVGLPWPWQGRLFNVAAVLLNGHLLGLVPKTVLPTTREFQETRWFTSGAMLPKEGVPVTFFGQTTRLGQQVFDIQRPRPEVHGRVERLSFGVEICQDLWSVDPPSVKLALQGASLIFNLSASNEVQGKHPFRRELVAQHSARIHVGYVYTASGSGESTTDLVFSGTRLIGECGTVLAEAGPLEHLQAPIGEEPTFTDAILDINYVLHEREDESSYRLPLESGYPYVEIPAMLRVPKESELLRPADPLPFLPACPDDLAREAETILSIQARGLAMRLHRTGIRRPVIGVSGGLDSTLALLIIRRALALLGRPAEDALAVTLPGPGTGTRTRDQAVTLMRCLGVEAREIDITPAVRQHLQDIGHDPEARDTTFENAQARERTQILMDLANREQGLVVGTGDLSELALGWCTYNADQMSMYGINASVPKTWVRALIAHEADLAETRDDKVLRDVLLEILDTPVSPELLPPDEEGKIVQETEALVGPYVLHDFFIHHMLRRGQSPRVVYLEACRAFAEPRDTVVRGRVPAPTFSRRAIRETLETFLTRFFRQQFKRSVMPDGPKATEVSLSPRADWRMPSDSDPEDWLSDLDDPDHGGPGI